MYMIYNEMMYKWIYMSLKDDGDDCATDDAKDQLFEYIQRYAKMIKKYIK